MPPTDGKATTSVGGGQKKDGGEGGELDTTSLGQRCKERVDSGVATKQGPLVAVHEPGLGCTAQGRLRLRGSSRCRAV